MPYTDSRCWSLDDIFAGGISGRAFRAALAMGGAGVERLEARVAALSGEAQVDAWATVWAALAELEPQIADLSTFAWCCSQAPNHDEAMPGPSACHQLVPRLQALQEQCLAPLEPESPGWVEGLAPRLESDGLGAVVAAWRMRPRVPRRPSSTEEGCWSRYQEIRARLCFTRGGQRVDPAELTAALRDPDRVVQERAFETLEAGWRDVSAACAELLERRVSPPTGGLGQPSRAAIALSHNRIHAQTLESLLQTCERARPMLWRYFAGRASLLGTTAIDWFDARPSCARLAARRWSWSHAQHLIVAEVKRFSPAMAATMRRALRDRWIDSEPGPHKHISRCVRFRGAGQFRIQLPFDGSLQSVLVLAHELGHGYHAMVLAEHGRVHGTAPPTLSELASTVTEAVVRRGLGRGNPALELSQISIELGAAVRCLIEIPAAFCFERRISRAGALDPDDLSRWMEEIQRTWFGPWLGRASPLAWAMQPQLYLGEPFASFPYTFGYLLGSLLGAHEPGRGPAGSEQLDRILADSTQGMVEDIVVRHLGIDLREPTSWQNALERLDRLVERYLVLVRARLG